MSYPRIYWLVCSVLLLSGCTTVGVHPLGRGSATDFGPPLPLRVCLLVDSSLSASAAEPLISAIQSEFERYRIRVRVTSEQPWERPGFTGRAISDDLLARPLPEGCDRLLALVGRTPRDFAWSLFFPEVLGAVEAATSTHGFVVAERGSLAQLLWSPPTATAVHEFYHLFGCPHALTLSTCYDRIRDLKQAYEARAGFFPGVSREGRVLRSRAEVNAALGLGSDVAAPPVGASDSGH